MFYFADVTDAHAFKIIHVFKIIQISTGGMLILQVCIQKKRWIWISRTSQKL